MVTHWAELKKNHNFSSCHCQFYNHKNCSTLYSHVNAMFYVLEDMLAYQSHWNSLYAIWAASWEAKPVFQVSDLAEEPHKISRDLKFWNKEGLDRDCTILGSKNKGADRLCGYCAADMCLCFCICMKQVSHDPVHNLLLDFQPSPRDVRPRSFSNSTTESENPSDSSSKDLRIQ